MFDRTGLLDDLYELLQQCDFLEQSCLTRIALSADYGTCNNHYKKLVVHLPFMTSVLLRKKLTTLRQVYHGHDGDGLFNNPNHTLVLVKNSTMQDIWNDSLNGYTAVWFLLIMNGTIATTQYKA